MAVAVVGCPDRWIGLHSIRAEQAVGLPATATVVKGWGCRGRGTLAPDIRVMND